MKVLKILGLYGIGVLLISCMAAEDLTESAFGRQYASKSFSIPPGASDTLSFSVNKSGSISASVTQRGGREAAETSSGSVALALNSPQGGQLIQSSGELASRVRLNYRVPRDLAEESGMWQVVMTNNSDRTISGTLKVYYPYDEETGGSGRTTSSQNTYSEPPPQDTTTSQDQGGYQEPPPSTTTSQNQGSPQDQGSYQGQDSSQTGNSQQQPQETANDNSSTSTGTTGTYSRRPIIINPRILTAMSNPQVISKPFRLSASDNRKVFSFNVHSPSTININAGLNSSNEDFAIILNGPGQQNALARKDGKSPLYLSFTVTQAMIQRGTQWSATVVKFYRNTSGGVWRAMSSVQGLDGKIQITVNPQ